jgi:hypothetical protein
MLSFCNGFGLWEIHMLALHTHKLYIIIKHLYNNTWTSIDKNKYTAFVTYFIAGMLSTQRILNTKRLNTY